MYTIEFHKKMTGYNDYSKEEHRIFADAANKLRGKSIKQVNYVFDNLYFTYGPQKAYEYECDKNADKIIDFQNRNFKR